jgi:diguanylate cyclase (GGDEF)-like protein
VANERPGLVGEGDRGTAAVAKTRALLADKLRAYEHLTELFARLLAEETLESLLHALADAVQELIPCSGLVLFGLNESGETLVPLVACGSLEGRVKDLRLRVGEGLAGRAVERREPLLANDTVGDARVAHSAGSPEDDVEAIAAVPLVARGKAIGCLSIYRQGDGQFFTEDEFRFVARFADAAALALDNARARARLVQVAQTDELTGMLNRRGFFEAAERELARASREGDDTALLIVDVDDLKSINDRFGHSLGDDLLILVAETLASRTRRGDITGRLGGDEFAVVLPGTGINAADDLAREFENLLRQAAIRTPAGTVRAAASVGVAAASVGVAAADGRRPAVVRLLANADADMYRKKKRRKARSLKGR